MTTILPQRHFPPPPHLHYFPYRWTRGDGCVGWDEYLNHLALQWDVYEAVTRGWAGILRLASTSSMLAIATSILLAIAVLVPTTGSPRQVRTHVLVCLVCAGVAALFIAGMAR